MDGKRTKSRKQRDQQRKQQRSLKLNGSIPADVLLAWSASGPREPLGSFTGGRYR